MKKVFLLAALVLACTAGSNASAMNEAALNASMSEMMPVKKTAKKTTKKTSKKTSKKTTTKKTSTKKTTSTASSTASNTAAANTAATTTSNAATSTSTTSNAGSAVAGILGAVLGGNSNSSSSAGSSIINGILNNVIGSGTFSKQDLCAHTWKYSKPGCAFTSENLLAKAGGEIAANKVEEKLGEYYSKFGFSGSNTYFTFKTDGTFAAKIDGKSWQGNYTFDEKTHAIQMKGLLLSMSGYATKTTNGISLLFDQKKLLNLIKTMGALKGSSTLSAIGTIANNYDGMRVGFEMSK
ncbi:DUF4923 family protein [Segatella copri]|uniref:DUF4923 family protein n=1 Tax=Segatella copri TaxID=165179 RepID=UPI0025F1F1B9|nr:DUF4923 family protein [Segatella copri]MDV3106397.1 DUF4923 family protein [Segatella copri]WOF87332.1 DUF4923 family protein [Segatella copri]WOF93560.1 DUF4923 family protein [Segatella copri]